MAGTAAGGRVSPAVEPGLLLTRLLTAAWGPAMAATATSSPPASGRGPGLGGRLLAGGGGGGGQGRGPRCLRRQTTAGCQTLLTPRQLARSNAS